MDPGHVFRRAGVDRGDAAMRDRAAEDLGVQHAGKPHGVSVFGAPGDLVARLESRQRAPDLRASRGSLRRVCEESVAPLPSSSWRAAPATETRVSSRLEAAERRTSEMYSASSAAASPARARVLSSMVAPASDRSAALRRVAFSVAALTTTRADLTVAPSASSATATPSAGQSSAEPVVTLR